MASAEAPIIAATLHAVLFGIYIVTFFHCLRWFVFEDEGWTKRKDIRWGTPTITFAIFALSTADLGITINGTLFSTPGSFQSWSVESEIIESLMTIIINCVLVYRCWRICNGSWRIYNGSWRIVVSGLLVLLVSNTVCLGGIAYWGILELEAKETLLQVDVIHWHQVGVSSTIMIDVCATSAIILQIRKNYFARQSQHLVHFVSRTVIASGLSYTLTSLAFLVAISIGDATVGFQLLKMLTQAIRYPIAAITFNIILIRVAHNRADENARRSRPVEYMISVVQNNFPNGSVSQSCPVSMP